MKRNYEARKESRSGEKWFFGSIFALVVGLAVAALWLALAEQYGHKPIATGEDLRISLRSVNREKLEVFPYAVNASTTMDVVVQKGKDGVIRASFAACRSCKRTAHYVRFGKLVCAHCGHTVRLPDPGQIPSARSDCIPVSLAFSVEGDELRIKGQTVLAAFGEWYEQKTGAAR
jgi:uncharacterized membrane protein